jgi:hypothetical protein
MGSILIGVAIGFGSAVAYQMTFIPTRKEVRTIVTERTLTPMEVSTEIHTELAKHLADFVHKYRLGENDNTLEEQ